MNLFKAICDSAGQLEPSHRWSRWWNHFHSTRISASRLSFPQPRRGSLHCLLVQSWLIGPNPVLTAPSGSLQLNTEAGEFSPGAGEAEAALSW